MPNSFPNETTCSHGNTINEDRQRAIPKFALNPTPKIPSGNPNDRAGFPTPRPLLSQNPHPALLSIILQQAEALKQLEKPYLPFMILKKDG